ncbi:MAG: biotin transporter BioY [Ruminococcaceae bacterium]|nr:biotin transporter BioY [Oscillospiraceae bacterium]
MKKRLFSTQDTARIAICTVFLIICSWISIPAPIPFSMQSFGAVLVCLLLTRRQSLFTIITYILLGMVGLPVFAGFRTGAAVISGPTGGYIIGFLCLPFVIVRNSARACQKKLVSFFLIYSGMLIVYTFGTLWYALIFSGSEKGLLPILSVCVFPYLLPDIAKTFLAIILAERLNGKFLSVFQ